MDAGRWRSTRGYRQCHHHRNCQSQNNVSSHLDSSLCRSSSACTPSMGARASEPTLSRRVVSARFKTAAHNRHYVRLGHRRLVAFQQAESLNPRPPGRGFFLGDEEFAVGRSRRTRELTNSSLSVYLSDLWSGSWWFFAVRTIAVLTVSRRNRRVENERFKRDEPSGCEQRTSNVGLREVRNARRFTG